MYYSHATRAFEALPLPQLPLPLPLPQLPPPPPPPHAISIVFPSEKSSDAAAGI